MVLAYDFAVTSTTVVSEKGPRAKVGVRGGGGGGVCVCVYV